MTTTKRASEFQFTTKATNLTTRKVVEVLSLIEALELTAVTNSEYRPQDGGRGAASDSRWTSSKINEMIQIIVAKFTVDAVTFHPRLVTLVAFLNNNFLV